MTKGKGSTSPPAQHGQPQRSYNTRSKGKKDDSRTQDPVDRDTCISNNQDQAAASSKDLDVSLPDTGGHRVADHGASHVAIQGTNEGASGAGDERRDQGAYYGAKQVAYGGDQQGVSEGVRYGSNEKASYETYHGAQQEAQDGASEETEEGATHASNPGASEGKQPVSYHVTSERTDKGPQPWFKSTLVMVAAVVLLIAIAIAVGLVVLQSKNTGLSQPDQPEVEPPQPTIEEIMLNRFQDKLLQLMAKFPEQHHRFWRTLNAATKRIIKDKRPIQPGVILIGSTPDTHREADCIARLFSQVVTETFESKPPVSIDVRGEYVQLTPEDAKVAMETSLWGGFGGGAQSAVISSLEEMHGTTAMLLHAVCDNDNAPFTKVIILFTLHTKQRELGVKDDAKVEEYLSRIWQRHLNIDDVSALLTRVANNVIIPKKESEDVLMKYC